MLKLPAPFDWKEIEPTESSRRHWSVSCDGDIEIHVLQDLVDCSDRFAVMTVSTATGAESCIIQTSDWQTVLAYLVALTEEVPA